MVNNLPFVIPPGFSTGDDVQIALNSSEGEAFSARILETGMGNCPAHFLFSFPTGGPNQPPWTVAWQAAAGRGFTREYAIRGAIYEGVERACLITSGEIDPRLKSEIDRKKPNLCALRWLNYSANQMHKFRTMSQDTATFSCGKAVDNLWINGVQPGTNAQTELSATAVMFGEDQRIGLPPVFSTSTGAALGENVSCAWRRATLELVERDIVAIWWYNTLIAHNLAQHVAAACLPEKFAQWLYNRKRITRHLILPSDLPATTVVALSTRADGGRPAIGAAAALDSANAVRAATLEMMQGEISLGHMRAAQALDDPPPPPPLLAWSDGTNALETSYLRGGNIVQELPCAATYAALVRHFLDHGIDVFMADLTRPELGIPVVKAVSPHLRDWHPRFGPGRLYEVPVALGLKDSATPEAELNPIAFVI